MAFSFSNLFKSKTAATKAEPEKDAGAPPPIPRSDVSSPDVARTVRVATPKSVLSMSMRDNPPPPPTFAPPPMPGGFGAPRSISFPSSAPQPLPQATPDETAFPDFEPASTPPPEDEHIAPDIDVILELGDFIDRIPPAFLREGPFNRKQPLAFHAADLYSDLSKGRASIPLSAIYAQCPELFARPVTPTEDTEISLPLQKLVEQMAPSFRARADQVAEENVGQIETPFLQVALEDQARMPRAVTPPPVAISPYPPAPTRAAATLSSTISGLEVAPPMLAPIVATAPAAPATATFRPTASALPPGNINPAAPAIQTPPVSQPPLTSDAAPAGRRLPSTVRASVAGGKIRLSGPALPARPPGPPTSAPSGAPTRSSGPVGLPKPGLQPPPTAQTAKKTARIQLPPIALRSAGAPAQAAPPTFRQQPGAAPVPPSGPASLRPAGPAPSIPSFKTPSMAAPSRPAPAPETLRPAAPAPSAPPSLQVPFPAIRTTILPSSVPAADSFSAPPVPPQMRPRGTVTTPPVARPAMPLSPPVGERIAPAPVAPPPAPAPFAPIPVPPPVPVAAIAPPLAPAPVAPPPPPPPAPAPAAPTKLTSVVPIITRGEKVISLSAAAIFRALPATSMVGSLSAVPDSMRVVLPFSLVEPQLALGRVSIPRDSFLAVLPPETRENFEANCDAASIGIPLQEVFQNLPMDALSMRADQVIERTGPEIPTPFGQKAAEDAKRFAEVPAVPPPIPAPVAEATPAPQPVPEAAAAVEPVAERAPEPEEIPELEAVETITAEEESFPEPEPVETVEDAPADDHPQAFSLTPIALTSAPTPAIPTAPLPPPPKLQIAPLPAPVQRVEPVAPEPEAEEAVKTVEAVEAPVAVEAVQAVDAPKAPEPVEVPVAKLAPEPEPVPVPLAPPPLPKFTEFRKVEPFAPPVFAALAPAVPAPAPERIAPPPISPPPPAPTLPPLAISSLPPGRRITPLTSQPVRYEPFVPPTAPPPRIAPVAPVPPVLVAPLPPPPAPLPPTPVVPAAVQPPPPAPRPMPVAPLPPAPVVPQPIAPPPPVPVAPVAVQPPPLKPATISDPLSAFAKETPPPAPLPPFVPEPAPEPEQPEEERQPGMAELQTLFMTDESLDAKKVVRLVSKLPGITACTVMFADGLTLAGNFPKELDGEGFSAMSPQFFKRAVAFATELSLGGMQTFSFYTDRSVLSFFMQDDICLSVMQTGRGFLPGVREKLLAVTNELSKMYARAASH